MEILLLDHLARSHCCPPAPNVWFPKLLRGGIRAAAGGRGPHLGRRGLGSGPSSVSHSPSDGKRSCPPSGLGAGLPAPTLSTQPRKGLLMSTLSSRFPSFPLILLPQPHSQEKNQAEGRGEACGEGRIPGVTKTGPPTKSNLGGPPMQPCGLRQGSQPLWAQSFL